MPNVYMQGAYLSSTLHALTALPATPSPSDDFTINAFTVLMPSTQSMPSSQSVPGICVPQRAPAHKQRAAARLEGPRQRPRPIVACQRRLITHLAALPPAGGVVTVGRRLVPPLATPLGEGGELTVLLAAHLGEAHSTQYQSQAVH